MAYVEQLPNCCGIVELGHIADDPSPEYTLMHFDFYDVGAHVVFSVTSRETKKHAKGFALANLIKEYHLGNLIEAPGSKNPGHTGTLKAWIWTPHKANFKKWQTKMLKAEPDKWNREANDYYDNPWADQGDY